MIFQGKFGILLEVEIRSISVVQGGKNFGGKSDGRKVKVLRSNNGGEYTFKEFKDYLASKGIKHQLSTPGRPEQNGVVECINRTLIERARSIRLQADILEEF